MSVIQRNKKHSSVIIRKPHVTEKATVLGESKVYTFVVDSRANKFEIRDAIKDIYDVTPVKVNIVNRKAKKVSGRGRGGLKKGYKKAYVYLKKDDSIELL